MTFLDRIKETSTSTGTGTFTLGGAVLGYKVFSNGTYKYCIVNDTESEWEVGEGTVASGILTRTTIEASSNGGAAVSFSAGTKQVFNTVSAAYVNSLVPYTGATASVNLGEFGLTAGQLTLDTTPTGTAVVGTTQWNDTIGSSQTLLKGGNVLLKNGVDLVARVVNKVSPATTLTKAAYKAVRVSGAQGQRLAIAYAQANNDNNSADTIGLVCETIAANQEGFIITVGQLLDVNTTGSLQGETWADGDVLYLSPTTAGNLTNIKPTGATGHIVIIGYVEYAHANNGKIYVKVMNGWELTELHDTYISSVANNDVLVYESSTTLWKNKSIATILGYTPADDSLVMKLAGSQTATGYKTFSIGLQTTTGDNYLNYTSGATYVGYSAAPVGSYKFAVSGDVLLNSTLKIQSNVAGGNTFLTIANQAGTSIATLTNGGALQFSGTATFSNTIGFNGKIGGSSTGGIAIVPGGVPSSLNTSQIYLLVSAPLGDYTSTYGLDQAGIYLGGTYNGGQGPQNMVLGPARYYNSGGTASNKWNFTISPASGQVSDGFGSDLILTGGIGRGTGTPGKFIIQTSTATTTGTTLQTLSNRLEVDGTGQLKLNGYTSTSVFTGTVAGLLGFDSSGNIITTSASGGGISGSGTAGQVTYWTGTSAVGGSNNLFWDNTNGRLGIGTNVPSTTLTVAGGLTLSSGILSLPTAIHTIFDGKYRFWFQGTNRWTFDSLAANQGFNFLHTATSANAFNITNASGSQFLINGAGNVLINSSTDAGYRLDVNGTGASTGALRVTGGSSLLVGGGNTSATNALTVQNSDSTNLLRVRNEGRVFLGSSSTSIYPMDKATTSIALNGNGLSFFDTSTGSGDTFYYTGSDYTHTSGIARLFNATRLFWPTSGNGTLVMFNISPNINQTGGANGITRGLYVNPTLTAAADFRAIETTNGKIVFGNLPTSSAGLPTGALWNNSGVINIV